MFNTVRNYQNPFQNDCNILQSHEQHSGLLGIPHLHKSLGFILAIYRYVIILQLLFAIVWWLKMLNKFLYAYVFLWSVCSNLEVKWKSLSHVWLCNSMDYTVHGILQARILEWVAFAFSRGSSQPRDQIQVSLIAGRFFTSWATKEAQEY